MSFVCHSDAPSCWGASESSWMDNGANSSSVTPLTKHHKPSSVFYITPASPLRANKLVIPQQPSYSQLRNGAAYTDAGKWFKQLVNNGGESGYKLLYSMWLPPLTVTVYLRHVWDKCTTQHSADNECVDTEQIQSVPSLPLFVSLGVKLKMYTRLTDF